MEKSVVSWKASTMHLEGVFAPHEGGVTAEYLRIFIQFFKKPIDVKISMSGNICFQGQNTSF